MSLHISLYPRQEGIWRLLACESKQWLTIYLQYMSSLIFILIKIGLLSYVPVIIKNMFGFNFNSLPFFNLIPCQMHIFPNLPL